MKIRSDVLRLYRDVHSWVGIVCGLLLFTCFYAGAMTMFKDHLQAWSSPVLSLPAPVAIADTPTLMQATFDEHPAARNRFEITLGAHATKPRLTWLQPDPKRPRNRRAGQTMAASLDNDGKLQVQALSGNPASQFIYNLHRKAGLPAPNSVSNIIVGLVALLYALALVSGLVVLLPSLVRDLFAVRIGKNLKRMWLDTHNVLGLFSFPFHLVIAVTAVAFCLHAPIYQAQDTLFYEGKLAQLWPEQKVSSHPVNTPLASPLDIIAAMRDLEEAFVPTRLAYNTGPTGHMHLVVWGTDRRFGSRGPIDTPVRVDPHDGSLTNGDYLPGHRSASFAAITSMFALHFGNFGGPAVRWTYFVLGLAGALLFFTGNILWVESRRRRTDGGLRVATTASRRIASLSVGWGLGVVVGVSLILATARWLPGRVQAPGTYYALLFYASLAGGIGWSLLRGPGRAAYELLWCAAAATAAIPLLAGTAFSTVDLVATVGALAFALAAVRVRKRLVNGDPQSAWAIP